MLFLSTPSARRATTSGSGMAQAIQFLSTPSARRATSCSQRWRCCQRHFYPRPLRGGRRERGGGIRMIDKISIHALCEEGDQKWREPKETL